MRAAYNTGSAVQAEAQLTALAKELDRTYPSAVARLQEGMAETSAVLWLDGQMVLRWCVAEVVEAG